MATRRKARRVLARRCRQRTISGHISVAGVLVNDRGTPYIRNPRTGRLVAHVLEALRNA